MEVFSRLFDWNFDSVLSLMFFVATFVVSVINFFRTGRLSNGAKKFITDEVNALKKDTSGYSQTFSEEVPDYVLNPVTNELEESPIPKNVQKYIDSYIDTALDRVIERFLPENVVEAEGDDNVEDYTMMYEDLAYAGEVFDRAEFYRDRFNLPDTMSVEDVYKYVNKVSDDISDWLKNQDKYLSKDKNNQSEVKDNETSQETK